MSNGTASMGKANTKKIHIRCRRCGHNSYNVREKRCSYCGFPSPRIRHYNWAKAK
ncbi:MULTISPECIES: 50S ribosomal protein L37e [Ferroplasma]|uniref:Large ribosomal subunit protein eL37 n=1 Tax=Ferroplasma acidiphilum TaxID=74969 RepID=A0A1V0N1Y0_9ARCH|nr:MULTISPECIES: 50S ribosomal protein L37e [Ferroplasma]ARD84119.1 50S ribosomal protein L37e [Ferroplasma acidiphilum]NOL60364.1 50S ribosomal protein L37e [Ferroplasma acidiphilum]WMT53018.1 MAG: 50S ribosomal protein L37e [Ferroplasma acidiphilum]